MSLDLFEMQQKAELLFKDGKYRDALNLLIYARQIALENKRRDALAAIHGTVGNIFNSIGDFDTAERHFEYALKISEQLAIKDPSYIAWVATYQNNLGALLANIGKFEEAKIRFEESLKMDEALLNKFPENVQYQFEVARDIGNFGLVLRYMGKFEESKVRFEEALKLEEVLLNKYPENVQYRSRVSMTKNNFGLLLWDRGRFEESKVRFEEALKLEEELLNEDLRNIEYQSNLAMIQNNFGRLLVDMGKFEKAKVMLELALNTREALLKLYSENTQFQSYVAATLNNLGELLIYMGNLENAKVMYERALKMDEALLNKYPENAQYKSDAAVTQNNHGTLLRYMGHFDDARIMYEKALKIREELLNKYPEYAQYKSDVAMTQHNLGALLHDDLHMSEDAKIMFEKALEKYDTLLNKYPENAQYQSYKATILLGLGNMSRDGDKLSEALIYYFKAFNIITISGKPDLLFRIFWARGQCYEKMDDINKAYEDYYESIKQIELIRGQFSLEEYKLDILRDKARVYSDMISLLCIKYKDAGRAWEYVGRAKSRTILDFLRHIELPASPSIRKDIRSKEGKLLESIRTCDRQARVTGKTDQATLLSQEITKLQSELDRLYDQVREVAPEYVDLRKGQPLSIKEIIDLLKEQGKKAAFIEYYTTPERIFIFVMHSFDSEPKVKVVDISSQQIEEYVMRYFREIVGFLTMPGIEETWLEIAEHLIFPVLDDIDGCEMLYLIPHGLLHYLPLHALSINEKRLIERFSIIYASSLAVIKYAQRKGSEKLDSCLSIGFTPYESERELFEGEASLVANMFKTKPYLGVSATSRLLSKVDVDVIHLSCHGYFNSKDPLNSGLRLSDDKMLTMKDLFNMNINTNLVVLSACETGLNKQKPGDELIGLTRAFLYSGAKSIMASLWSVSADSTLKLMESFYKKLRYEKMSKAEALQKAQIEMIHNDQYSYPYYWAPFILIGDWK